MRKKEIQGILLLYNCFFMLYYYKENKTELIVNFFFNKKELTSLNQSILINYNIELY